MILLKLFTFRNKKKKKKQKLIDIDSELNGDPYLSEKNQLCTCTE